VANQFDARIRFDAIAWRAFCPDSGAVLTVIDNGGERVSWSVRRLPPRAKHPPFFEEIGSAKNPKAARAKARRILARHVESTPTATEDEHTRDVS